MDRKHAERVFLSAKAGREVTDADQKAVKDSFWGPLEDQNYYSIRTYALLFPFENSSLERYREAFWHYWHNDLGGIDADEIVGAIIVATCNYWNAAVHFEPELKEVLQNWQWEGWEDTCNRAASQFAKLTHDSGSSDRFDFLKTITLGQYDDADPMAKSVLVDAVVVSLIGNRASPNELRSRFKSKAALEKQTFN